MANLGQPLLGLLIVVLGGILSFSGRPSAEGTELCETKQQARNHIELCHVRPRPKPDGPYRCETPGDGFVLKDLKIAPLSQFSDCGPFRVDGFLGACFHEHQKAVEGDDDGGGFEASVFHLLSKVSGKSRIDNKTVVNRVTFAEPVSSSSSSSSARKEGSSAFVSFKSLCKPVRPAMVDGQPNGVLKICSRQKVNVSYVFLAFHGDDLDLHPDLDLPRDAPVRCRCTLRPSHTVTLRALDIRLQGSGGQECSPGASIKLQSQNETKTVGCQGLSAHYDLDELYSSQHEVTLDFFVSARAPLPTAVWIQASEDGIRKEGYTIEASCEGTRVLDENSEKQSDTNLAVIVGGVVVLAALVIIIVFTIRKRKPEVWTRVLSSFKRNQSPPSDTPREQGGNHYTLTHPNHEYTDIKDPTTPFIHHHPPAQEPPSDSPPPSAPPLLPCPNKPGRTFTHNPAESGRRADDVKNEEEYNHLNRSSRLGSGEAGDREGAEGAGRNSGSSGKRPRGPENYDHLDMVDTLNKAPRS